MINVRKGIGMNRYINVVPLVLLICSSLVIVGCTTTITSPPARTYVTYATGEYTTTVVSKTELLGRNLMLFSIIFPWTLTAKNSLPLSVRNR